MSRFCRNSQRQLCLVVVMMIFALLSNPLLANNRVALVVGNSDYGYDSLKNPINDAKAIERVLDNIGFNVISALNANKSKLDDVLYQFGEAAETADIAIIYYAGHAIEVDGRNYLMPTGVKLKKRRDIKKLIDMQEFVEEAGLAKTLGLVIIDACRDNPFAKKLQRTLGRSVSGRGLARVNTGAGSNTLVAFATEAGQLAQDGSGANSPYAKALINNLSRKNTDVRQVFGYVRDDVMSETQQSQQPYTYGSLSGQAIYLTGKGSEQSSGVGRLTIKVEPEDAKIRIMNIVPRYRAGIELAMGSYDVYVTREGYKAYRRAVSLSVENQVVGIVMDKLSVSEPITRFEQRTWSESEMVSVPIGSVQLGGISLEGVSDKQPLHREPLSIISSDREVVPMYTQSHALLVGVSKYTNGWSSLSSVTRELDMVQEALEGQGFNVVRVDNPDSQALYSAFNNFIANYGHGTSSRLLFYYSGHAYSDRNRAYLVPSNAPLPDGSKGFLRSALDMKQIIMWIKNIDSKHALFLFDSCFSGAIFHGKSLPKASDYYIESKMGLPVRQFITAGSAGEPVPAKSVFTPIFVDAITKGLGDLNEDGYVTGSELGFYLSQEVPRYVDQTPQYGKMNKYALGQGDFVFFNTTVSLTKN